MEISYFIADNTQGATTFCLILPLYFPQLCKLSYELSPYVIVSDLLGSSLEDLFNFCNRKFSLQTVLLPADQLLSRVKYVHAKSFIHRDINAETTINSDQNDQHEQYGNYTRKLDSIYD